MGGIGAYYIIWKYVLLHSRNIAGSYDVRPFVCRQDFCNMYGFHAIAIPLPWFRQIFLV